MEWTGNEKYLNSKLLKSISVKININ